MKAFLIGLFIALLVWFVLFYVLLIYGINQVSKKIDSKYGIIVTIEEKRITNFFSFQLQDVLLIKKSSQDTIFNSSKISATIDPIQILTFKARLSKLEIDQLQIQVRPNIFKPENLNTTHIYDTLVEESDITLTKKLNNLLIKTYSYIPDILNVKNLNVKNFNSEGKLNLLIDSAKIYKNNLTLNLKLNELPGSPSIQVNGKYSKSDKIFWLNFALPNKETIEIPYLEKISKLDVGFDSMAIFVKVHQISSNSCQISTIFRTHQLNIDCPLAGKRKLRVDSAGFLLNTIISDDQIIIDSSSIVKLGKINLPIYFHVFSDKKNPQFTFQIPKTRIRSMDFFESLPSGAFETLDGIRTKGWFEFQLSFTIFPNCLDSVKLFSSLRGVDFQILKMGNANLQKMNSSFVHEIVLNGELIDSFKVGNENPYFVPLEEISPYLRNAVLTAEDGSFFHHSGFNLESIAHSISSNLKEQRFARGGSTISMQLVKNVYLSRNKNISRKLEEMLIVWLIENQHLVSKERMYEVYLNIIEWAPGIYGIYKASNFYFNKHPSELDLNESIYLSALIPRPSYYIKTYDHNNELREYFKYFFEVLPPKMIQMGRISESDTIGLIPFIEIRGEALEFINREDSIRTNN